MPRVLNSPVARWPGSITLSDPLDISQVMAIDEAKDAEYDVKPSKAMSAIRGEDLVWTSGLDHARLPAILVCVEKWELENFSVEPKFPATPRNESHQLVDFLWKELQKIYDGEVAVPNE